MCDGNMCADMVCATEWDESRGSNPVGVERDTQRVHEANVWASCRRKKKGGKSNIMLL